MHSKQFREENYGQNLSTRFVSFEGKGRIRGMHTIASILLYFL